MKNTIFCLFIALAFSFTVHAQPGIKFDDTHHDFGKVPENSYPTWLFKFTNTGNQDLVLTDVKASCGCTSPQWTRDPVKPGDTGQIKVVFNAAGYAGRQFTKSVTVTTNIMESNQAKQEFLLIQGNVMAKEPVIPQYAAKFSELKHDLGTIKPGKKITWPVTIINDGDSNLTIKTITSTCSCITFKKGDYKIAPHQSIAVNATFNSKGIEPKSLNETIKVTTNLPVINTKQISDKGYLLTVVVSDGKKPAPPVTK